MIKDRGRVRERGRFQNEKRSDEPEALSNDPRSREMLGDTRLRNGGAFGVMPFHLSPLTSCLLPLASCPPFASFRVFRGPSPIFRGFLGGASRLERSAGIKLVLAGSTF